MQIKHNAHSRQPRSWRSFAARDGAEVERQLRAGAAPCCPWCGNTLEARPTSRLTRQLVLDARGIDLDCRECRRFWCVVLQTPRSLRLLRMRRLAAAVRGMKPRSVTEPPLPVAGIPS